MALIWVLSTYLTMMMVMLCGSSIYVLDNEQIDIFLRLQII